MPSLKRYYYTPVYDSPVLCPLYYQQPDILYNIEITVIDLNSITIYFTEI